MTDAPDMPIKIIDATGYHCPIPVLKARKSLQDLAIGERVRLMATDKASCIDVPHFCNTTAHILIDQDTVEEAGRMVYYYTIEKGA